MFSYFFDFIKLLSRKKFVLALLLVEVPLKKFFPFFTASGERVGYGKEEAVMDRTGGAEEDFVGILCTAGKQRGTLPLEYDTLNTLS